MDIGITLTPKSEAWKITKLAEDLGFSHAWFYDTQLLCADIFVAMSAAAMQTSKIKLGAGVLIPSNRLAAVAATGMASLNQLAPGRMIAGLGTGYTARRTMGLPAHKLADLQEYVRVVKGLWNGEIVETKIETVSRKVQFLQPEGFVNTMDKIPVHISAFGPKARKLTADIADGFINAWTSPEVFSQVEEVRSLAIQSDNNTEHIYATCLVLGCILEQGEPPDSARARAQAGPFPAILLHQMAEDGEEAFVPPHMRKVVDGYREIYQKYRPEDARYLTNHKGHLMFLRPEEEQFITSELIKAFTLTGTPDEILTRVGELEASGYDQVAIQITHGQEAAITDWARLLVE
jgi:5,10-methylenetetrahydromethanopterin reductase